jgi:hypothetical protein
VRACVDALLRNVCPHSGSLTCSLPPMCCSRTVCLHSQAH